MGKLFILFTYLSIALSSSCAFSTCIVIYRTDKEIIVGADSRRLAFVFNEKTNQFRDVTFDNFCKIRHQGSINYAVAGFNDDLLHEVAMQASKGKNDLAKVAADYIKLLTPRLEASAEAFRRQDINKYKERFQEPAIADVAFFGFDKGKPVVIYLMFLITTPPNQPVRIRSEYKVDQHVTLLGVFGEIVKMPFNNVMAELKKNPVTAIRRFIGLENKANPMWVGGPIDVMRVNVQGRTWVAKKKICG
ncbi:hypothetical protein BN8_03700 [Fibrisoma limi BUZ 3]|uniref:Lipoprotein n=2 Tax=Fibrisoma limi TaxID=663275 RepID=I2GKU4_9BACT|nr:hypothetical protein BN8_03700 [Fibrisoma limi BUZ 3]